LLRTNEHVTLTVLYLGKALLLLYFYMAVKVVPEYRAEEDT